MTTTYKHGEFRVDIVDNGTEYEAWIYKNNYGIKSLMFGAPCNQQTMEEFINIVKANLETYEKEYNLDCNEYGLAECVYDLTTIATMLIHDYDLDVDSRCVSFKIYELAKEFTREFDDETDDYMLAIEDFGYRKLMDYFEIKRKIKGYMTPSMKFEVEADSTEEAARIITDKLKEAGFQPSGNIMNDIVFN